MKVALCISGMSRSFKKTYPSVLKHVIERYNPDVFISTWKPTFVDRDWWPDVDPPEELIELYKPIKFDIEIWNEARQKSFETNEFKKNADWGGAAVSRMIPMFYKIYLANLHCFIHQLENKFRYDVVIRCRSDLEFHGDLVLEQPQPNTIYFPQINNQNGVNDQFWYADSDTSNAVCGLYLSIGELWHAGIIIHGELLLYAFQQGMAFNSKLVDIPYGILR